MAGQWTENTEIKKIAVPVQASEVWQAAELLKHGEVVAFPTETVYGLGALGLDEAAVAKLYEIKNRPREKAFSLQVADIKMIEKIAACVPEYAKRLMEHFCPGPLTVVLPKKQGIPDIVTGGKSTVGIRIPANPVALALLKAVGEPLAVPSANISGEISPKEANTVYMGLKGRIPLILDGGCCNIGVESTIVDCTGSELEIIRHGAIADGEIMAVAKNK